MRLFSAKPHQSTKDFLQALQIVKVGLLKMKQNPAFLPDLEQLERLADSSWELHILTSKIIQEQHRKELRKSTK